MIRKLFFILFCITSLIIVGCGVSGTVTDEDGAGIPGVEVNITTPLSQEATVTDSDGSYHFDFSSFGIYSITVYLPPEYSDCTIEDQKTIISALTPEVKIDFSLLDCYPGACCDNGDCTDDIPKAVCQNDIGGEFLGGNSQCASVECVFDPIGACCAHDVCADDISQSTCEVIMEGDFLGEGSECVTVECNL